MTMDTTAAMSTEEMDAQLASTLREIDPDNYAYLFERCKRCNVKACHLRFFKKDQIHELIPKSELGILAEFEYLLSLWQISKGYASFDTNIQLNRDNESYNLIRSKDKPQAQCNTITGKEKPHILINTPPVVVTKHETDSKPISINLHGRQISSPTMIADELDELLTVLDSDENSKISNADRMKFDEGDDEKQFKLETIIPELLKELKDSYELKDSLSTNERRFLCHAIVDYFESRNIKLCSDTMAELAEQIVEHFPTEDKKSWYNRDGPYTRGSLFFRLHNLRRNLGKQTNNTSTSKAVTNSTSSEDEYDEEKFTLETIIPELLKKLKDRYESKDFLSAKERRLLCSSIVDYFENRKIKLSLNTRAELAEQIVEHFPTEDKKSWCNRDGPDKRGRLYFRLNNSRKNIAKQTSTNFISSMDEDDEEQFTLEKITPQLLRELKDSYQSKNSLSTNERRFLCSAVVDYFISRNIKFSSDIMNELAEQIVEHFPTEDKKSWCNRDGPCTRGRLYFHLRNLRKNMAKQTNNTYTSKGFTNSVSSEDEDDQKKFTLETIIPELLNELKDSYESTNSLSRNERRLLCSSIVDYFESRNIKFSLDRMVELAEQIVEHFPTEDKKSWCNRDGRSACGSFVYRLYNVRRNMAKKTNNTSTSKVVTNSISSEDEYDEEQFTLEIIIPELLNELKCNYESKNSLSTNERRLICSSIVDYFESRKIKLSLDTMDDLAEQIVEHFPKEDKKSWCNRDGSHPSGRIYYRFHYSRKNMAKQTNNTSTSNVVTNSASSGDENSKITNAKRMKFDEHDEEKFTLETIIPELLKELKDSYESKDFLSAKERRLLCSSIVDYFENRKIKFSSYTMSELAEQIVEHFPTEDKKSWCNPDSPATSGRLLFRLRNSRKNISKQTSTNFTSRKNEDDEEQFTLEKIIPELLKKLKCSYESKGFLSRKERRRLCSSIVDYFENRKIKFSSYTMDVLADQIVEHFPTEDKKSWCNRDSPDTRGCLLFRLRNSRRNMAKQTSTNFTSRKNEDNEEKFTLETIIPELLKEMKDSYESKNSLSTDERRLLCRSIVDYFESRKIKFSLNRMDELAEQIAEHFPTEDKKSWYNCDGPYTRGSLVFRLRYLRRNKSKQTNNTSTSKVVTNSTSSEPESREEVHDEDSKSIQAWLKSHKCENFSEIIDLWEDTMKYRCCQTQNLKDHKSIREFLNNWPSYKLETGDELLTMDFRYLYPQAMETFRTRWLVYKQNIEQFLKVELKDVNSIKLLEKYQLQKATINEDSSSCILIYLVHAITKPLRHFEAVNGNVSYAISDSQHSMMRLIRHKAEIDEYTEPYPCIFVVGNSMLEVQDCYVVFMDLHYKLSYENCLAVCVQIFTILKVEDPPASKCYWEFIRGYMFNIAKDKEKFNLGTANMVNYLETVASSV